MTNYRWSDEYECTGLDDYCWTMAQVEAKRRDEMYVQEEYRPRTTTDLEHMEHHEEPHDFD